ncbi:GDSL esterase/lipase At3g26430-like [Aristolochia californica]|uniref:GDSL esterase/lipase At3g26430-like n=1 Tax=Aristolochia californica TaxID=171875 RepID=UPI0035DB30D8
MKTVETGLSRSILSALLGVLFVHVSATSRCEFSAVFNFGDSNSDTGGLAASFWPAPEPNGESFWGHPAGRYSDGRLVIDFIANNLGLPYLDAYLNSLGTNFSHGANFATAGATIRRPDATLFESGLSPFPLDTQFSQFSQFKSRSQIISKKGGVFKDLMPKGEDFSRALYTFDIGQNDLTHCFFNNMTSAEVRANVPDILRQFTSIVKDIYEQGGRYFLIHNTGPFGCLAYVIERVNHKKSQIDKAGCVKTFNRVAQYFNKKLKEAVVKLRKEVPSGVFTYVDIYSLKYSLITHATKYGFEKPLEACCGHGGKYNYNRSMRCGSTVEVNGTRVLIGRSCRNPQVRVIWDGIHYTQAANRWVFDGIRGGSYSDPPTPLYLACQGNIH